MAVKKSGNFHKRIFQNLRPFTMPAKIVSYCFELSKKREQLCSWMVQIKCATNKVVQNQQKFIEQP